MKQSSFHIEHRLPDQGLLSFFTRIMKTIPQDAMNDLKAYTAQIMWQKHQYKKLLEPHSSLQLSLCIQLLMGLLLTQKKKVSHLFFDQHQTTVSSN